MKQLRFLIVEDDVRDAVWLQSLLSENFPSTSIQKIATECEFRNSFASLAAEPPDIAFVDPRLRWSDPGPDMPPSPPDVTREGSKNAGLRCRNMLATGERTKDVPVVFLSASFPSGLRERMSAEANVEFHDKATDATRLLALVRSILSANERLPSPRQEVFIVHGHDSGAKEAVARFIEQLGASPIILHEQANVGDTIMENIERHSAVAFAIVLLTPDDTYVTTAHPRKRAQRARQNVIFEFGFFVGRLGRRRVCALHKRDTEPPSDLNGLLYICMDPAGAWKQELVREMRAAGLVLDVTRLL